MIFMAVGLAGVAGFLFFRRPVGQVLPRRLTPVVDQSEPTATPGARSRC
jgi:hypothetical protein